MGYCVEMTKCKFFIRKENEYNVFNALKELLNNEDLRWVDKYSALNTNDLGELLYELGYSSELDQYENIINLNFCGEKLGDDYKIFKVIAPFVKRGSYIEMLGEDEDMWRWSFDGKTCIEIFPNKSGEFQKIEDTEEDFYEENFKETELNNGNKKRKIFIIEDD